MGKVAETLAELTVTRTSPDGNISARIRAGELAGIAFRPGAYESYGEPELAHQLARTATLLYTGHERAAQRVMDEAGIHRPTDPGQARDEAQRRFLLALQEVYATGTGSGGLVAFQINGMARWTCQIAPGTLRWLPEPDFLAEVTAAAADLLSQSRFEKALLKNEFFGARMSPLVRERKRR